MIAVSEYLGDHKDAFGAFADIVTSISFSFAAITAWIAWRKYRNEINAKREAREDAVISQKQVEIAAARANARQKYEDYLRLAFDNPQFSMLFWSDRAQKSDLEVEKYQWFVSRMLWACEEVLLAFQDDSYWISTIDFQLSYNRPFFASKDFDGLDAQYTPLLKARLDELRKSDA